ncbi:MAG TPA: hypothetical protein VNP92_06405 [Actinophytocola sp.]|nr:hypothetical protein [Actinophytocola sp.]
MSQPEAPASSGQSARLVVSWLVVGIPLVYGLYQTIKSVLPLFGG